MQVLSLSRWLPESPRWLMVKGRFDEIVDVFITRAASINNLNVAQTKVWCARHLEIIGQRQVLSASTDRKQSFVNILRSPQLFKRLLAMCYMW